MNRFAMLLCLLLAAGHASAATVCRLVSGGGMAFGTYDVLSTAPNDTLLQVAVTCERNGGPQGVTLTLRLGPGANGSAATARRMAHTGGSGDFLNYGLYRDVARSATWGSTDGVDTVARALNVPNKSSASTTFTIYGRIPPQQDVSVGSYGDTVQITLTP